MALETLERGLQPSAGLKQHLECISKTLSMSFKPAQVTRTRSAEWYAVFRTMVLSSAGLTNAGPADAFTDNPSTALQCTRRSVSISELSPSLPVEGHTGSQDSARPELRLVSATVAQKRKSPPRAQSEESARGPWGTLHTAWPRLQGQKSEHSADLYNMHSLPVYLANSTPALSTSCMSRHCKVKHRGNPAGRTDKSAPSATIVLGFPMGTLPPSHAHPKPVEIQALNFSNTSASPSTRKEAGWSPAGLRTDLAHKWVCGSRSCKELPNDTCIPWLPAHTGDTTSQKLSVVFHTADHAAGTPRTAMPSPSAKLKSSRRLPKYLRTSGAAPSGALAEARSEAEARYARGASNQHGQHSSVQGKRRQEAETENQQWRTASWYDSWYTQGWQSGWYNSAASGYADNWQARPASSAAPAQRWLPRTAAMDNISPKPEADDPSGTSTGPQIPKETEMDSELDREDTNMDGMPTTPKAEGTRLSAPEDSSGSSDELIAEPARETGAMYSNRCRANSSDSEELFLPPRLVHKEDLKGGISSTSHT